VVTADADADLQRPSVFDLTDHVALGAAAVLIFAALHLTTGRLDVNDGAGVLILDGPRWAAALACVAAVRARVGANRRVLRCPP
jgi:hypothetical protein